MLPFLLFIYVNKYQNRKVCDEKCKPISTNKSDDYIDKVSKDNGNVRRL